MKILTMVSATELSSNFISVLTTKIFISDVQIFYSPRMQLPRKMKEVWGTSKMLGGEGGSNLLIPVSLALLNLKKSFQNIFHAMSLTAIYTHSMPLLKLKGRLPDCMYFLKGNIYQSFSSH